MGADCFYDINTEKHTASRLRKPSRIVALRNNAAFLYLRAANARQRRAQHIHALAVSFRV